MTHPAQKKHCPACGLHEPCPVCSKPRLAVAAPTCACDEHGPCLEHEPADEAMTATLDVVDEVTRLRLAIPEVAKQVREAAEEIARNELWSNRVASSIRDLDLAPIIEKALGGGR